MEPNKWRKSSHSGGTTGNCVEVAAHGAVLVRDTEDNGHGPVLKISLAEWHRFTKSVRG
jgi:hypothetical protein